MFGYVSQSSAQLFHFLLQAKIDDDGPLMRRRDELATSA